MPLLGGSGMGEVVGWSAAVIAAIALVRTLLLDRSAFIQQKAEIVVLRADITTLKSQVAHIEGMYDEQRTLKHKALNDLTKATLIIKIVEDLYAKCECGVLDPIIDVLRNITDPSAT